MKKNSYRLVSIVAMMGMIITGCSYHEFEDDLMSKIRGETKNSIDEDQPAETPVPIEINQVEDRIYEQGEIPESEFGVNYNVVRAYMIDNIYEAGISEEDIILYNDSKASIDENGNIIGMDVPADICMEYEEAEDVPESRQYAMLLLDVEVENTGYSTIDYDNDGDFEDHVYMDGYLANQKSIENPGGMSALEYIYLNPHGTSLKSYRFIPLKVGEKKKITYGWLVPKDWLDREWYFVIKTNSAAEYGKANSFIKFTVEKGET